MLACQTTSIGHLQRVQENVVRKRWALCLRQKMPMMNT